MIVFFFVPLLETKQSKHQRTHEQQVIHLFLALANKLGFAC